MKALSDQYQKTKNYFHSVFCGIFIPAITKSKTGLLGALVVLLMFVFAIFAPFIAPYDPTAIDVANRLKPPSLNHWMGTDLAGRDVLSRSHLGCPSIIAGWGAGSDYRNARRYYYWIISWFLQGSFIETALMRATEIIAAVPLLIVAVAIVGILGVKPINLGFVTITNEIKIVFVLGILYIPGLARVVFAVCVWNLFLIT